MKVEFNILEKGKKPIARYGICETPVGKCLLADTDRGICWLSFVNGTTGEALAELEAFWGEENLKLDAALIGDLADRIFAGKNSGNETFPVLVSGTSFQLNQWKTLTELSCGDTITYSELAQRSGFPKAVRAAGTAIGKNNVSFLIPCHRIVRSDGSVGNYRWGPDIKKKLVEWERKQKEAE